MKVKIFQAWGHSQVAALEKQINEWLESAEKDGWRVKHTQIASAGTGTTQPDDEIAQAVTITVWCDRG